MAIDLPAIYQLATQIFSGIQAVEGAQQSDAQQATLDTVLQAVNANLALTRAVLSEVLAVESEVSTLQGLLSQDVTAILFQLDSLRTNPPPVRLPPTPPPGYGGASPDQVWGYIFPATGDEAGIDLEYVYQSATMKDTGWFRASGIDPNFAMQWGADLYYNNFNNTTPRPTLDLSVIAPSDTLLSLLEAQNPTATIIPDGADYYAVIFPGTPNTVPNYLCVISKEEFALIKAGGGGVAALGAPVWPGLSGVTLGTPVALSTAFSITGPMQGVILDIASVNTNRTTFDVDGMLGYKRIGSLVFLDDNGDVTDFYILDFVHQVYLPRNATEAAAVRFNCDVDTLGTATPFTIP